MLSGPTSRVNRADGFIRVGEAGPVGALFHSPGARAGLNETSSQAFWSACYLDSRSPLSPWASRCLLAHWSWRFSHSRAAAVCGLFHCPSSVWCAGWGSPASCRAEYSQRRYTDCPAPAGSVAAQQRTASAWM